MNRLVSSIFFPVALTFVLGSAFSVPAVQEGRITGNVIDVDGNPVKKVKVVLIKVEARGFLSIRDEIASDCVINEEGRFEFDRVPAGEYLLGINITESPGTDAPYLPTYYPGVADRSQATRIKIGDGEKLESYTLRVGPEAQQRVIAGVLAWRDGTPAPGAYVYLSDQSHPGWFAWRSETDAAGRFTLKGYEGIRYWVLAGVHIGPQMHAEPPLISDTGAVSDLILVLTSEGAVCEHYYKKDGKSQN
jgi:hypothetical protein